jgi:hypothetical protein
MSTGCEEFDLEDGDEELLLQAWREVAYEDQLAASLGVRDDGKTRHAKPFDEKLHPRGQPDNAGEFVRKGDRTAESVATAEPPAVVAEPPSSKPWSTPEQRKLSLELYRDGKDAIDKWERGGGPLPDIAKKLRARKAEHFRQSLTSALSAMTATALERAKRSLVGGFHFHNDTGNLTQQYQLRYRTKQTYELAGWFDMRDGTIDVNGDPSTQAASEIYAHELAHAVDWARGEEQGGRFEFSSTAEWKDAWKQEIDTGHRGAELAGDYPPLSEYAWKDPGEGFAEFGRLVHNNRELAERKFPKCWEAWKKWGLV